MKDGTTQKYAIESPMYKIGGGLYDIYLNWASTLLHLC